MEPKEESEELSSPTQKSPTQESELAIQGTHLLISLMDTEGKIVDNRAFISTQDMDNIAMDPPVLIMDTLRRMAAELIAHIFPDEINQLPIPARPEHPNEKGNLN